MATITQTSLTGYGARTMAQVATTGTDTMTYDPTYPKSVLIVRNPTGGALTLTLTGSTADAEIEVPGYGTVSAAAGYSKSIGASSAVAIPLDSISEYLAGTITISGEAGLYLSILKWA